MEKSDNLALYKRPEDSFESVFDISPQEVIASMDEAGDDIPNQTPEYQITLPTAGVTRRHIPVNITDPLNPGLRSQITCEVVALTEVPALRRGIHMSRIGNYIAQLTDQSFESIQEYAGALAEAIQKSQYGGPTHTKVHGVYSYLEQVKGKGISQGKMSLENIGIHASVLQTHDHAVQTAGLVVTHLTACPCVQETLKHTGRQDVGKIAMTHSQRCETSISVENLKDVLPTREILEALDRIIFRTRNTLPRDQEALLVYQAHARPQFVEDVIRLVTASCFQLLKSNFPDSSLHVLSRSQESIHDFDIIAELNVSIQKLKEVLEQKTT